ncbi:MAG: ATP-binding protein [Lachnospiraceae bacterium]|nr:ATP-binding protein [Lachnospiraceae bacterium]
MFVGREKELQKLNLLYQSDHFEFAVFYGRRRVGKTTLIKEFIKDKDAFYYMAVEGTQAENLFGLSGAIISPNTGLSFSSYEDLLKHIDFLCSDKRQILVIDEYPYLAASYPAISSLLQSHIDNTWQHSRLFLILCGSSMSFMENQVLGYKSPLYGRRTAQFKLHPFTYFEARQMLTAYTTEEQAIFYGITGGIPEYLRRIRPSEDLDTNITELFFDESGRLFEEPSNLLKQELKEPATYHSIISAIASGHSRINEIATKTGLETSGCSNQISALLSLGIVRKEIPVTEKESSRKTLYSLNDTMFLFWYRFVRPNISAISRGAGSSIYDNLVKPQLPDFMGKIFEEICKQYLFLPTMYSTLPFPVGNLGRWWGSNPFTKKQEELDLMAVLDNQALLGECKWKNTPVDTAVIEKLLERGALFPYQQKWYYIFSKTGFTDKAMEYGSSHRIVMISFDEMNDFILGLDSHP